MLSLRPFGQWSDDQASSLYHVLIAAVKIAEAAG
jgi:hypothetical protein